MGCTGIFIIIDIRNQLATLIFFQLYCINSPPPTHTHTNEFITFNILSHIKSEQKWSFKVVCNENLTMNNYFKLYMQLSFFHKEVSTFYNCNIQSAKIKLVYSKCDIIVITAVQEPVLWTSVKTSG